jgi:UDP-2-acetamido-2,6-beta-L-arabino-hexul-4-ose reductase
MRVLVTGSDGFLGKNLTVRLAEQADVEILRFTRRSSKEDLVQSVQRADFIFHLAGVNRPQSVLEFASGNVDLTVLLCEAMRSCGRRIPIVYASSIQAERDNPYGQSKLQAEQALARLHEATGSPVHVFRLPNVFGKWCRPNYNSAVATFCHNIARQLPVQVDDPAAIVNLVYVDDVASTFLALMKGAYRHDGLFASVEPTYRITVGELVEQIRAFQNCRTTLISERVGTGITRALYATYVSYLPVEEFAYTVAAHSDPRGVFVEMLKTPDAGQFSYFTAHPGVTRGGHYHHSKTEKFLVISGRARFRFRHLITDEYYEISTSAEKPEVVETIPGWTHDITNIGDDQMIVMLWANEIFDRARPDTIARRVSE